MRETANLAVLNTFTGSNDSGVAFLSQNSAFLSEGVLKTQRKGAGGRDETSSGMRQGNSTTDSGVCKTKRSGVYTIRLSATGWSDSVTAPCMQHQVTF